MARGKRATRAAAALTAAGLPFELRDYELPADAEEGTLGEAVAAVLGVPPSSMFKTLIAVVDGSPTCAIVPASGTLSLKTLAAAAGGKRAKMAGTAEAEKWTGYVVGGISPIGQSKRLPTFLDASAEPLERVFVSAGQRGLQLELSPATLTAACGARLVRDLGIP